ncbi:VOC family protein [Pseudotamlana agarivorans]|uniref:VOC family protein n=1 Tax=Pseudotamlana agarivorans TaxID=481183 RepID=UPI00082B0CA7|nr:VOC family protein [Tamlana agarivorans]
MKISSYLTFDGNCREAMTFYKECLGGDLMLQLVEGSPMANKMPQEMKKCILHSTLTTDAFVIMGSDMTPETGLIKGNATSMVINCGSEAEIRNIYEKLSREGVAHHKIETTFWGTLFGDLTDKFGNNWMLNYDEKNLYNSVKNEEG